MQMTNPPPVLPMLNPVTYFVKSHFGKTSRYIVDSTFALAFKELTGRTVLLDRDLKTLAKMGFRFEEVAKP